MSWEDFKATALPALRETVHNTLEPVRLQSPAQRMGKAHGAHAAGGGAGAGGAGAGGGAAGGEGGAPADPPPPQNPVRDITQAAGAIMGLASLPLELLNTGFAMATAGIAAAFPALPAATMGSLYLAPPHAHSHPPSLIPPAPPIPLPSIGAVLLGCTIKVLINSMPAARAGDIGLAVTCGGILPMFEIKTGSSNVFIGGVRAARMLDISTACLKAQSTSFRAALKGMIGVGTAMGVAGIASDLVDAVQETDPAMQQAEALAAGIDAAAMAVDMAAAAISASMGSDPAIPPLPGVLLTGAPNVLIGGFPMPNIPDPVQLLLKKLKSKLPKRKKKDDHPGKRGCKTCNKPQGAA